MAAQLLSPPRYSIFSLLLLLFHSLVTLAAKPTSSFSLKSFRKEASFDPEITLSGDAQVGCGGDCVHITQPHLFSGGRLLYKNPIRFKEGSPSKPLSFSTYFEFSISPQNGDGLAFVVLPSGFPVESFNGSSFGLSPGMEKTRNTVLAVEFDTLMDRNASSLNANQVVVNVGGRLAAARNASSVKVVLNSGKRLHCWIDYEASSKRVEVRLSGSGSRPYDPLISYRIDLFRMWKEEDMFVGFSSSNQNSTQSATVYSWSFRLRHVPSWFHSLPLDPHYQLPPHFNLIPIEPREPHYQGNVCLSKILTTAIFCISCVALTVFIVLLMKAIFANSHAVVVPVEYPTHPGELGYEKIKIGVEKAGTTDAKKVEP